MEDLPTGLVTFLLTDVEGSTALWERDPVAMRAALARHDAIIAAAVEGNGGRVLKAHGEGDSLFAVFEHVVGATSAALAIQRTLADERWQTPAALRVRIALNTGEADARNGDYYGTVVNRTARLRAVAHGGQTLVLAATAELARDVLPPGAALVDLGEHLLRDLARSERIYQLVHADVPSEFPPLRSLDAVPNNLPRQLTSFVGRERELTELSRLLGTTALLTVTGAGGSGKTRLAIEAAAGAASGYSDGVWLSELAPLGDPSLLPNAILGALGIPEDATRGVERTLVDYLRPREALLLLDNCEHLIAACAVLVERLLRACPRLRILATSREALGIAGEVSWRLPSLAAPDPRAMPTPAADGDLARYLLGFETVRLFAERASAADPTFALTDRNGQAVAQICYRLDGMPLAIELAAARARSLAPEQIAERLDDRFRLLTGGSRTAFPRQQTLRATLDWSHGLLSDPDRALLRRLAVFAGGWTLDAAETVCSFGGVTEYEVLDVLSSLVDKSLVVVVDGSHPGDGRRYRLLETVRQYAAERLADSGEAVTARDRHRDWILERMTRQGDWQGLNPLVRDDPRFRELSTNLENVRAALGWCQARSDGPDGQQACRAWLMLAVSGMPIWYVHGHFSEGLGWLEGALAASAEFSDAADIARIRAYAMMNVATLALRVHDVARAELRADEAAAIARATDEVSALSGALGVGGEAVQAGGDLERARAILEESLRLADAHQLSRYSALARYRLGRLACVRGDNAQADELLQGALAVAHADKSVVVIVLATLWQARAALALGHVERSARLVEDGLHTARELGFRRGIALGAEHQGLFALARNDRADAQEAFAEALRVRRDTGEVEGFAVCLEGLAASATLSRPDDARSATRLLGAADAHRTLIANPRRSLHEQTYRVAVDAARQTLGDAPFEAAFAEGSALPVEQAIADALSTGDAVPRRVPTTSNTTGTASAAAGAGPPAAPVPSSPPAAGPLTPRERQVAALLGRGLTNRQVADELVLSERTVEGHVANVLNRLGFSSRSQIAAWAVRHSLVDEGTA